MHEWLLGELARPPIIILFINLIARFCFYIVVGYASFLLQAHFYIAIIQLVQDDKVGRSLAELRPVKDLFSLRLLIEHHLMTVLSNTNRPFALRVVYGGSGVTLQSLRLHR